MTYSGSFSPPRRWSLPPPILTARTRNGVLAAAVGEPELRHSSLKCLLPKPDDKHRRIYNFFVRPLLTLPVQPVRLNGRCSRSLIVTPSLITDASNNAGGSWQFTVWVGRQPLPRFPLVRREEPNSLDP